MSNPHTPTPHAARIFEAELKSLLNTTGTTTPPCFTAQHTQNGWVLYFTPEQTRNDKSTTLILSSQRKAARVFKSLDALNKFLMRLSGSLSSYRVNMR